MGFAKTEKAKKIFYGGFSKGVVGGVYFSTGGGSFKRNPPPVSQDILYLEYQVSRISCRYIEKARDFDIDISI
jgi:hypothetical protein